ncbi:helix-turn-helix domain-containing protein [Gryllotalpicola reticulitermitis]|uniref:Helix-turn-helix domain-containing protein n=1 Tax=Gryllotalpicola reticulitermitis TaxID=1184153 RepID=A0ABV8Q3N0_9MICO
MGDLVERIFTTTDVGEAEALTRRIYPRTELRESTGEFHYEQITRGAGGVNFTRFKINSRMDIAVDFDGVAAFGLRLAGGYAAESNQRRLDSSQPFLFIPGPGSSISEDLDILMVNVDLDVLTRAAAQQAGADSAKLVFHSNHAASQARRQHWLRTINYAWNNVMNVPEIFRDAAIRGTTIDVVIAAALAGFEIETDLSRPVSDSAASTAIRRAVAFVESNADQPITVGDIAAAARLSVRGLQLGFQRCFGVTPMAYLRIVRLEAARAELLAADGSDDGVATIARRWAFANPGRFAALYRARFDERPADTLRR